MIHNVACFSSPKQQATSTGYLGPKQPRLCPTGSSKSGEPQPAKRLVVWLASWSGLARWQIDAGIGEALRPAESLLLTFQRPISCSRVAGDHHGESVTRRSSFSAHEGQRVSLSEAVRRSQVTLSIPLRPAVLPQGGHSLGGLALETVVVRTCPSIHPCRRQSFTQRRPCGALVRPGQCVRQYSSSVLRFPIQLSLAGPFIAVMRRRVSPSGSSGEPRQDAWLARFRFSSAGAGQGQC